MVSASSVLTLVSASAVLTLVSASAGATKMTLVDKVTFTLGVVNVAATPYVLGRAPQLFYLFYTPKAIFLLVVRYYDFLKKKKQWLLMDFCYWANFLLLYYARTLV